MIIPISVNYEERGIDGVYTTFIDANDNKHEPENVMAAINNAATGEWETWPPTKPPEEGDQVLADMGLVDKTFHNSEHIVLYFIKGVWTDAIGRERPNVVKFAYINTSEKTEATK